MTLSVPNTAKAVLIGASNFPKDDTLSPINQAENNIKSFAEVLADQSIIGINDANIIRMMDVPDNTKIKEEVSIAAEEAKGALIVYITGHITTRKGHLYLATPNSSRKKIHINGIALDELLDIISETNAETRVLIFDAYYSDVNDEETEGDVVVDALKYYESAYLNTFILSASPSSNFMGFKGSTDHTAFTEALVSTLRNGIDKEQEELSLEDIHDGLKERMTGQMPLKSTAAKADKINFSYNTKFLGFRDMKRTADRFFEDEQFQQSLNAYEEASKLFGKNAEVAQRKQFIKCFLEGEKAVEKGNFNKAKEAFLEAQTIFDMKVVSEKINGVLMTIANTLFDKEEYELARENYKMVAAYRPNDGFIKERLEKCDHELRFLDLIDEADKYYFEDDFEKALALYGQALQIHPDRKAAKRKEECERLLHKAALIRERIQKEQQDQVVEVSPAEKEKLEKELRKSITDELSKDFEAKQKNLEKALSEKISKEQQAAFDEKLWSNISLANSLDVYEFFIQYYPDSAHIDKAKAKLDELSQIVTKQKQKAEKQEKVAEKPPVVNSEKSEEKAKEVQEKRDSASKKHKPFIQEEKGRSHVSEEKPYNILEELEAQFNNTGEEKKEKKPVHKTEKAPENSAENQVNKVMKDDLANKEAPKEDAPKKEEKEPEKQEAAKKEEKPVMAEKVELEPVKVPKKEEKPPVVKEEKTPKSTPAVEEPKAFSEEELWQNAVESNSVEGYRFYVDNTKESEHLVDAYYQINKLSKMADAGVIDEPKEEESTPVIERTVSEAPVYPTNEVVKEEGMNPVAEPVVEETPAVQNEEEELWQKATEANTVNAYYEYVANSKEKAHLEEAKQLIASLKENARESEKDDWESAESANTIDAYKNYIKKYPLGHYYAKAMFRISELEAQL
ncbi:MAG: caspase family protein [Flammeovirgaceae bacterium]